MSALQPRTLSNQELIKYFAMYMDDTEFGAPIEWQIELLRRFLVMPCLQQLSEGLRNLCSGHGLSSA